jgi:L-lactate permease
MEHNTEDLFKIEMSNKLRDDLRTAGNWAKIISILGFVSAFCAMMVNLSNGSFLSAIFGAAFSVLLYIFLLKFGSLTKKGIDDNDQDTLNDGLLNLRTYFKIVAWLLIIVIVFVVIYVLFFVLRTV